MVGSARNKTNSAPLELELGLSLVILCVMVTLSPGPSQLLTTQVVNTRNTNIVHTPVQISTTWIKKIMNIIYDISNII